MLKIGEFSVLSQISIHMLRHYNDIELLIPEYVDDFTGSTLPELPAKISGYDSGVINPHQAQRDIFADTLEIYADTIGDSTWKEAAIFFRESGKVIESINNDFIEDVINQSFEEVEKYVWRFQTIKENEEKAFKKLLG